MKKDILVSVIVPIYNVEKYLDCCINSIVNQTYQNIEIILVDDGSLDNCPKICDEWQNKDKRIKVIHKQNEGLGMARNTGMKVANGNYICFVDSDDMIDNDMIGKCLDSNYDIICFGFKTIDVQNNILMRKIPTPSKKCFYDDEIINEFLPNFIIDMPNKKNFNMNFSSCMCLISKKVIDNVNWRFISEREIISEDLYSLLILYKNVKSIKIVNKDFYSYRINNNSLSRTYRDDRYDKVKKLHIELLKLYENDKINERIHYLYLSYTITCLKQIVGSNLHFNQKKLKIKQIINDDDFRTICKIFSRNDSTIRKIYLQCIILKLYYPIYFLTYLKNKESKI